MLSEEERGRIEDLEKKLENLVKGGICGSSQNKGGHAFLNIGCWFKCLCVRCVCVQWC